MSKNYDSAKQRPISVDPARRTVRQRAQAMLVCHSGALSRRPLTQASTSCVRVPRLVFLLTHQTVQRQGRAVENNLDNVGYGGEIWTIPVTGTPLPR